jgi:putative CocE/NonD family hydrolase
MTATPKVAKPAPQMVSRSLAGSFAGVALDPGVAARMRDGATLVADVYRPEGEGPWPVLLMRTAYGRDIASSLVYAHPAWFSRHGFIVVVQDVRGRGDSDGSYYPFKYEREDGYDSVQWASALPGSNGCVGLYGFSYQGAVQLFAALDRPPALRALAPHMTAFDFYSGWFYRNGILELSTIFKWANQMLRDDSRRLGAESRAALDASWLEVGRLYQQLPLRRAAPLTNGELPRYAADWLNHPTFDAYWEPLNLLRRIRDLGYPMFHMSGWYDIFLRGSIDGFKAMAGTRDDQFLLAGPWVHSPWGRQIAGVDLGPSAAPGVDELVVKWFRHWLRPGGPSGHCPLQGCRYFSLGENAWHSAATWPPPGVRMVSFHLASGGRANSRSGDGRLAEDGPNGPEDTLSYEPEFPVAAPSGSTSVPAVFGPHDLSEQQQSNSLLVYTSPPMTKTQRIAGQPHCVLHVTASSPTVDLVVRLSKVGLDGRAMLLCLGAVRATAPTPTEVAVPLDPVAASWAPGECIRVDIGNSAFPLFPRNSGTEADALDVGSPGEFKRALVIVNHDSLRPSSLRLPLLGDR